MVRLEVADHIPHLSNEIEAMVCWMSEMPMLSGKKYLLKHLTQTTKGIVKELMFRVNINNLVEDYEAAGLSLNEIGRVKIKTQTQLIFDEYKISRSMGAFVLIDVATHATVGAGMICEPSNAVPMPNYEGYVI